MSSNHLIFITLVSPVALAEAELQKIFDIQWSDIGATQRILLILPLLVLQGLLGLRKVKGWNPATVRDLFLSCFYWTVYVQLYSPID